MYQSLDFTEDENGREDDEPDRQIRPGQMQGPLHDPFHDPDEQRHEEGDLEWTDHDAGHSQRSVEADEQRNLVGDDRCG
ncbi:MAG: hypothetical protein E6I88_14790 [Chloroflexi bacterium]|nr:MAG: hypothetical protein E6I88_14790 [Chloroflexota bacterium]